MTYVMEEGDRKSANNAAGSAEPVCDIPVNACQVAASYCLRKVGFRLTRAPLVGLPVGVGRAATPLQLRQCCKTVGHGCRFAVWTAYEAKVL
jgi:hypothetical protein